MFTKAAGKTLSTGSAALIVIFGYCSLFSPRTAAQSNSSSATEFPVIMRQNVNAGKTPVGTKVQAELVMATMANGVVIPRGAILSGEVTESSAKSKSDRSRLAIRMDSAQWKNGSTPIKLYLTAWYYPEAQTMNQDVSFEPADQANSKRNWNGQGAYPDPNNHISQQKFPGRESEDSDAGAPPPATRISKRRILMKDVESASNTDGAVTLTSEHMNIKIDKLTTYVLADSDLRPK